MYFNPSASTWRSQYAIDSAVLPFHQTLPSYAETPLRVLPESFCEGFGVKNILVKDESRRFGLPSYKILGASWACFRLLVERFNLPMTVPWQDIKKYAESANIKFFTATDGNWGRAVARMANMLGVEAYVYVPKFLTESTKQKMIQEGAYVKVAKGDYDVAHKEAVTACAEAHGLLVEDTVFPGLGEKIPEWVIEGYSTMMVEIDHQTQELVGRSPDLIVVPIGAGSLGQAVTTHFKHGQSGPTILTVEPETAACLKASLDRGILTTIQTEETIMCGMNVGTLSTSAWPILQAGVDASITVTDAEAKHVQSLLDKMKIHVGPCSCGTLAGFIKACEDSKEKIHVDRESVVVILATEGPRGPGFDCS